jgi:hypothetical protein
VTPPEIKLDKITDIPTAMFVGTKDSLGDEIDCLWAKE